jgi:serine/threonine protein kinase
MKAVPDMPVRLVSHEELPGPLKGYRLLERLGRGGFGEVWKCEAPGGLLKAVKFVFGDLDGMDEDSRPAEQEAKALERVKGIRHPYILSLEQFRVIDGQLIIVMELADRNLWDRFRECRGQGLPGIPREELLSYMTEAAEALDLMNNYYQIQHLDIKPQNLFLVFNHIKVADFGLAKALEGIRATVTGGVTPVYAAPETFEGWVSRFSDQYSLAIVFQELLTGTRPFTGTNTRQLLMQHLNGTPEMSALSEGDRQAIGRALAKKPDDRWPTCTDLVRVLKESGAPPARPASGSRPQPGSGTRTQPAPMGHAIADSVIQTRPVPGGPVPVVDPEERTRARTPLPSLPPLKSAGGAPGALPPLHTPAGSQARLVTPLSVPAPSTGLNPALTLGRKSVFQTARMGTLGVAPPERTGDGALFPALVVALGHSGRMVAEALKRAIADRHGSAERVPHIRFLYLDTDPEALAAAASSDGGLAPREVLPIRLNRSTHYLQRDGLPNVEQWLPHGLLYKLPRNPGAANGVRAFGRLALVDNFRAVAQRVRQEVDTFLSDEPLNRADQSTRLGTRSNRPRAYVLAGLGGGTGGGTFLDVAFLLRRELKQAGFVRPEVVGQFFVPPPAPTGRSLSLGNAYAALAEFYHFQAQRSLYQTAFDKSEGPITDDSPPFARAAVLQVPADAARGGPVFAAAAQALYTELLTPAGRIADEVREVYRKAYPLAAPACQTFGLYRLNWPRHELLAAATRRLAHGLLACWTGKEAAHLREPVAGWLSQQWAERKLSTEAVTAELNAAARDSVREDPDRVFDAFVDPLTAGARFDADAAVTVLDHLLKLVGKPECEGELDSGSLFRALSARYDELVKEVECHVGIMAATFIEVPQYRLPGAEETVRQFADRFKRQVEALEPSRAALDREVRATYGRLLQALGALAATGAVAAVTRKANAAEVLEHLRAYPRARLRLHVLDLVLAVFRRLRANAPEYLRDINSCRAALAEMGAEMGAAPPGAAVPGPCATILPDGCAAFDDAADQFLAGLSADDLLAFDQQLQKTLTRKFRGLGSICLQPLEKGPPFRALLLAKAREFLDSKLDHSDAARVFLRSRTQAGSAEKQLAEAFDEAAPLVRLTNARAAQQLVVLAVPAGEAGERVQALARATLPDVDLVPAALPDDICFYRELPQVPLADLPHLGGQAREAYLQMAGDHPAHSRVDVPWQHPG